MFFLSAKNFASLTAKNGHHVAKKIFRPPLYEEGICECGCEILPKNYFGWTNRLYLMCSFLAKKFYFQKSFDHFEFEKIKYGPLFVYFRPFLNTMTKFDYYELLRIKTQDLKTIGTDESTELWQTMF